jgi:hypothetical protein
MAPVMAVLMALVIPALKVAWTVVVGRAAKQCLNETCDREFATQDQIAAQQAAMRKQLRDVACSKQQAAKIEEAQRLAARERQRAADMEDDVEIVAARERQRAADMEDDVEIVAARERQRAADMEDDVEIVAARERQRAADMEDDVEIVDAERRAVLAAAFLTEPTTEVSGGTPQVGAGMRDLAQIGEGALRFMRGPEEVQSRSEIDGISSAGTETTHGLSMATSAVALSLTSHGKDQSLKRDIDKRRQQKVVKHGTVVEQPNGRLKFRHEDTTVITDYSAKKVVTTWDDATDDADDATDDASRDAYASSGWEQLGQRRRNAVPAKIAEDR